MCSVHRILSPAWRVWYRQQVHSSTDRHNLFEWRLWTEKTFRWRALFIAQILRSASRAVDFEIRPMSEECLPLSAIVAFEIHSPGGFHSENNPIHPCDCRRPTSERIPTNQRLQSIVFAEYSRYESGCSQRPSHQFVAVNNRIGKQKSISSCAANGAWLYRENCRHLWWIGDYQTQRTIRV